MIKVKNNPSVIHTATDYKKFGKDAEIERARLEYLSLVSGKYSMDDIIDQINKMVSDGVISVTEKKTLKSQLDAIERDWAIQNRESNLAGVLSSTQYITALSDYTALREFLTKVTADMSKPYEGSDVQMMVSYFNSYYDSSKTLQLLIDNIDTTSLINIEICSFTDNFEASPNLYAKVTRNSEDITNLFIDGTGDSKAGSSYHWKFEGFDEDSTFSTRYAGRYDSVTQTYRGASFDLIESDLSENGILNISLELDYETS